MHFARFKGISHASCICPIVVRQKDVESHTNSLGIFQWTLVVFPHLTWTTLLEVMAAVVVDHTHGVTGTANLIRTYRGLVNELTV